MAEMDELVIKIAAEKDASFDKTMKEAENASKRIAAVTDKMNESYSNLDKRIADTTGGFDDMSDGIQQSGKELSSLDGVVNTLAGTWRLLGVAAATAGAAVSAAGVFTINEGKKANDLNQFSDALGLSAEEVSLWSAAVRSAGGDAQTFLSDIEKIGKQRGRVTFDMILKDAEDLSKLSPIDATNLGGTLGWSPTMVNFLRQGPDGVMAALERSRSMGHGAAQQDLDDLQDVYKKYATLEQTIGAIATRMGGDLAPATGRALEEINNFLVANQRKFEEWASHLNNIIDGAVNAVTGKFDIGEHSISAFNRKPVLENLKSDDPEVRQKAVAEQVQKGQGSEVVALLQLPYKMATRNPVTAFEEFLDQSIAGYKPARTARDIELRTRLGEEDYRWHDRPARPWHSVADRTSEAGRLFSPAMPEMPSRPGTVPESGSLDKLMDMLETPQGQVAGNLELMDEITKTPSASHAPTPGDEYGPQPPGASPTAPATVTNTYNVTNNFDIAGGGNNAMMTGQISQAVTTGLYAYADGHQPVYIP